MHTYICISKGGSSSVRAMAGIIITTALVALSKLVIMNNNNGVAQKYSVAQLY